MVFTVLKTRFKILKRRIDNEFNTKEQIIVAIFFTLFIALITYLIFFLLSKFNLTYSLSIKVNTVMLMSLTLLLLSFIPLKIFKSFFEDKKIEILLLSPMSLKDCFLCEFFSLVIKIILIFLCIMTPILIANCLVLKLSFIFYLNYMLYSLVLLLIICLISYITVFFLGLIIRIQNLKKITIIYTGILELLFACSFIVITNYIGIINFINNIYAFKFAKYFFYFSELMFYNKKLNLLSLFLIILTILVFYKISYFIFYKSFYINGFSVNSKNVTFSYGKTNIFTKLLNKFYFYNKDRKLLFRNFNSLKSIIFTVLIFIISTICTTDKTKDNYSALLIINQFMTISLIGQVCYNIILLDKSKFEEFYLSKLKLYDFYIQKDISAKLITFLLILIYNIIVLINFNLDIKQCISYLLINSICIILISKPITLIVIKIHIVKRWDLRSMFDILKLIFYTLVLYIFLTVLIAVSITTNYLYFIILYVLLISLLTKLINKLIHKLIINKKLNFI